MDQSDYVVVGIAVISRQVRTIPVCG